MSYQYRVYGFKLESDIELSKLETLEKPENRNRNMEDDPVIIKIGSVDEDIIACLKQQKSRSYIASEVAVLYYENLASFQIIKNKTIIAKIKADADKEMIQALILSNCMGIIMVQREIISIHGGAVVCDGRAVIVSGISGAGKSTLCNELRENGYLFLSDDTVPLKQKDGMVMTYPAYPYAKLCEDAAKDCGYDVEQLELINEGRGKYAVNLQEELCREPVPVDALIMIQVSEQDQVTMEEVVGSEKIQFFMQTLYCYKIYTNLGMSQKLFLRATHLADKIRCYRITRPNIGMTVEQQRKLITS